MSMRLVTGPAGSGKTARAIGEFTAALGRGEKALFLAPSGPDAHHFERRILREMGIIAGGQVTTFDGFCRQIRNGAGRMQPVLSDTERRQLLRAVIDSNHELTYTRDSARFDGFVEALGNLISRFRDSRLEPSRLADACSGIIPKALNNDIFRLYEGYLEALEDQQALDQEGARHNALNLLDADPARLGTSLLVMDGFWDFTPPQFRFIELCAASETDLLITLQFEPDRVAFQATARQLERLSAAADTVSQLKATDPAASRRNTALTLLDSRLFEDDNGPPVASGGTIGLIEAIGVRGQAELVAAEILHLYREKKTALDDIAVVCRSLGPDALAVSASLDEFGIPHDFQGTMPLADTPVGRTSLFALEFVLALLGGGDAAADPAGSLLSYLRSALPVAPKPVVDEFARRVAFYGINDTSGLLRTWKECGAKELAWITEIAAASTKGVAPLADRLCTHLKALVADSLAGSEFTLGTAVELDMASLKAVGGVCRESASVQGARDLSGTAAVELLHDGIKTAGLAAGSDSSRGCVRILDPHRILNQRFDVIFVCGLLEKQFPASRRDDPFLSRTMIARLKEEGGLDLDYRTDDEHLQDERFLFHHTLTRAGHKVYLCYPYCDTEGKPSVPSLFVDEVFEVLDRPGGDDLIQRRMSDLTFSSQDAPTTRLALQALALRAGDNAGKDGKIPRATVALLEEAARPAGIESALRRCLAGTTAEFSLGEAARQQFAGREVFSATSLEKYLSCPYKYFLESEIAPVCLDADTFFLDRGNAAHCVLAKLGRALKRARTILWRADARQLAMAHELVDQFLDEVIEKRGLGHDVNGKVLEVTLRLYLHEFVDGQKGHDGGLEPSLFEFPFGGITVDGECGGMGSLEDALRIGGRFALKGKIDRIDVEPGKARALVIDYKTARGAKLSNWNKWPDEGSLQIQLYMLAARELMGLEPVGGEYFGLADGVRRGIYLEEHEELIGRSTLNKRNRVTSEQLREELKKAEELAVSAATGIDAGEFPAIPNDPKVCQYCDYGGICRVKGGLDEVAQGSDGNNGDQHEAAGE